MALPAFVVCLRWVVLLVHTHSSWKAIKKPVDRVVIINALNEARNIRFVVRLVTKHIALAVRANRQL